MSNVQKFGKIQYIEPNDILEDKSYTNLNGTGSFNIPHPYEDYSISVDLLVKIPSRCGVYNNKKTMTEIVDYSQGKTSFFSGADGYMTDNVTTITYKDILNNKDTKESLGITNIHITYNSYFYPEVTINFTDVRGAALMMPHEENNMREEFNKNKSNWPKYSTKVKNFFSSLFSFPYPEFILRVKGLYGKKVDFSLLVVDFRSSFNNSTGNFDATAKFVGKMYGVYTDIPMSHLLLAPYCKYGVYNEESVWDKNNFRFSDGTPIPTFLDLKKKILTINGELESNMSQSSVDDLKKINDKLNLLQNISTEFNSLKMILKENADNVFVLDNVALCKKIDGSCDYLYKTNAVLSKTQTIFELIKNYNEQNGSKVIPYIPQLQKADSKIDDSNSINVKKDGKNVIIEKFYHIKQCPSLNGRMWHYLDNRKIESEDFYIVDGFDLHNALEKEINAIKKKQEDFRKECSNKTNSTITDLLGFKPSVKNIFHILMAHLQTFTEIFSIFIDNVLNTSDRTLVNYGLSDDDVPDINPDKISGILPPFPSIKDVNTNEFCYPTSYYVNGIMEETVLIDSLFDATTDFNRELDAINELEEQYISSDAIMIPTCITDLLNGVNPYTHTLRNGDNTIGLDWIFTYFGIRCVSKLIFEGLGLLLADEFGKCEAYNFWRVNMNLSKNIIDALNNEQCNSSTFINFLSNNDNYLKNASPNQLPCYYNEKVRKIITINDGNIGTSTYNTPAIIARKNNKFDGYYVDSEDELGVYSFDNGSTLNNRPTNFIQFINVKTLENWNDTVNSLDLSGYCDETRKKIFTQSHLDRIKDGYINNLYNSREESTILFRETSYPTFMTYYKNNKTLMQDLKVYSPLQVCCNENYIKGSLESMIYQNNGGFSVPIFFYNDENSNSGLTPKHFLLSIPHNIERIANALENGKCVLDMPKSTVLFLGMIIDIILNKSSKVFYETITQSLKGVHLLPKVIACFLRDKDGKYDENVFKKTFDYVQTIDYFYAEPNNSIVGKVYVNNQTIITSVTETTTTYKYTNDYLGLSTMYKEWSENKNEGGFSYFKDAYSLTENIHTVHGNYSVEFMVHNEFSDIIKYSYFVNKDIDFVNTISGSGKTLISRLMTFSYNLGNNISGKDSNTEIMQILNRCYKPVNNLYNTGDSPFSDRYSSVFSSKSHIHLSFNENFSAYKHLNNFIKEEVRLVIPYQMKSYEKDSVELSLFTTAFNAFRKKLLELYGKIDPETGETKKTTQEDLSSTTVSTDNKYAMYRTLKNLYDKHFSDLNDNIDLFKINTNNGISEFDRFHYIDTFYRDIGDDFLINLDIINELISVVINGYENGKGEGLVSSEQNVYSFMSLICQRHNMMLMAMPFFNGSMRNENDLENMFKPIPYNKSLNEYSLSGPSYVCFYPNQPSQHLDIPDSEYKNDGFDIISDLNDTGSFTGPNMISDLNTISDNDYTVPAFGVEYGSQKQSIFKNINVNMDNPQTTEVSVANLFNLANSNNEDKKKLTFTGQDLYKIYTNYSYTCQVEMMGCSQIQPLMYFQLNNIPLFRGAYQIIHVEHNISPGDMTTTFKGVRINRTKMPMISSPIVGIDMDKIINNNNSLTGGRTIMPPLNIASIPYAETNVHSMNIDKVIDYDEIKKNYHEHIYFSDGQKENFNNLNPSLRMLIYCIVGDLKKLSNDLSYKLGIYVTSSTRYGLLNGNNKSDHMINASPSERRMELKGKSVDGIEKLYSEMGCAIDFHGTKNGVIDKGEASIQVFSHIAKTYQEYIRQLIWEVNGHSTLQNKISVIHLASYGKLGSNGSDKNQLYLSEATKYSGVDTGCKRLPSEFIKIIKDIYETNNGEDTYYLNNFPGGKTNIDDLNKLYDVSIKLS